MAYSLAFLTVLCATWSGLAFATADVMLDDVCLVQRGMVKQFPSRPFYTSSPFNVKPIHSFPFSGAFGVNKMAVPQADQVSHQLRPDQVVPNIDQIVALGPHMASVVPDKDKQIPTQVPLIQPTGSPSFDPQSGTFAQVPPMQPPMQPPASPLNSDASGAPCEKQLAVAREELAKKTLALSAKQTEMQELETQLHSRNPGTSSIRPPKVNDQEIETLKESIAGIDKEIQQSQQVTDIEITHMKENTEKFNKFKEQFVPAMRKGLEEFKNNAESKIQALEGFLKAGGSETSP